MKSMLNNRGAGGITVFLWFLGLFLVAHVGFKLVPMYMDYIRMQDEMKMKAGVAQVLKDEEIRKDLVNKARELDLPLTTESFILSRDEGRRKMMIRTKWDVEVNFLWGSYIRTFHFEPVVEESIMSIMR